jgi:hypothetical protein
MLKNLPYVWLGVLITFLAAFLALYLLSFIWVGGGIFGGIAVCLIPFLIAIWHIWKRTEEHLRSAALLIVAIITAIASSYLISIPLTPPFRYFLNSIYSEISLLVYVFLYLANIFLCSIIIVFSLNFFNTVYLNQNKRVLNNSSIVFFTLSGLMSLLLLFVLSFSFHIPNSFLWFYDFAEVKKQIARYNQLPDVDMTDFKMPDNYHYLVAALDKRLITLDGKNRFAMGFTYCPFLDGTDASGHHFVVNKTDSFDIMFNAETTSLEFPLEPFELYMQPSLNGGAWMQIGACQKTVELPKKFFDLITKVRVVFIEPDGETFRAYTYDKAHESWHIDINKGNRDYIK